MTLSHPLRNETFFLILGLAASAALHSALFLSRSPTISSQQFAVQPSDFSIEVALIETSSGQQDPITDPVLSTPTPAPTSVDPTPTPTIPSTTLAPTLLPRLTPTLPTPTLPPSPASSTILARPDASQNSAPLYPDQARKKGWTGTVLLRAQISAQGTVERITLLQSSGCEILDQSATTAVRKWHFHPQTIQGQPTPSTVEIPVKFTLKR